MGGIVDGDAKKKKGASARPKKSLKPASSLPAPKEEVEEMHPEPMLLDDTDEDDKQYDDDFDLLVDDDDDDERGGDLDSIEKLHSSVVQSLYDQEEELLNTHMASIQVSGAHAGFAKLNLSKCLSFSHFHAVPDPCMSQENAELLTEEGKLLQGVQGDDVGDYDIDQYAAALGTILDKKSKLCTDLQARLSSLRIKLQEEEELSKRRVAVAGGGHGGK